jgi:sn-glycerol 3-phosphate transport system substrate-binding protein
VLGSGALAGGAALAACEQLGGGAGGQASALVTKPTNIEVLMDFGPTSADTQAYNAVLAKIKELTPNLNVTSTTPAGAAYEQVLTRSAAGNPPDISGTYVAQTSIIGARRLAEPLQSALKSAKDWSLTDYFDGCKEAFTYKGDLILAPQFATPRAMVLNLNMLDQAGLKVPTNTWTWADYTDYAVKLTRREGNDVKVFGAELPTGNSYSACDFYGCTLWSHGADWVNRQTNKLAIASPEAVEALEMWVNVALRQKAAPTTPPPLFQGIQGGAFVNGLAAISYLFSQDVVRYNRDATFRWQSIPMPRKKAGGSHFAQFGWYIVRDSRQKDGAAEFIRIASLPDQIAQWCATGFEVVTRKAAQSTKIWQDHLKAQPQIAAFNDALSYMKTYPPIAGWQDAMFAKGGVGDAVDQARQGNAAPKTALEEAVRVMEGVLAQNAG